MSESEKDFVKTEWWVPHRRSPWRHYVFILEPVKCSSLYSYAMWCCRRRSISWKASEAGVDDGKVNDCRRASSRAHLLWLQTVGSSRPSKTSHHLLLFLNLSVLHSIKLGNFLFGFQQRKDLIAPLSPFLPSQMFPVWISIPFQLFFFNLRFSLHSSAPKTNTSVILTVMTPIEKRPSTAWVKLSGSHPPIAYLSKAASIR